MAAFIFAEGETGQTAKGSDLLVLLAYRLAEGIYFDIACLFSQLLLGYEIFVVGMKGIE